MILPLLLSLAQAAPAGDDPALVDPNPDVIVTRTLRAPPGQVYEHMLDLRNVVAASPERCLRKWELGDDPVGKGAAFEVVYLLELFRRKLEGTVTAVDEDRRIEWDHEGNRGFITRFSLREHDGGTRVTVHTWLNPPPWPFKRYYFNTVQPKWEGCYVQLLENLDEAIGPGLGPVAPAPVEMPVGPVPEGFDPEAVPETPGDDEAAE